MHVRLDFFSKCVGINTLTNSPVNAFQLPGRGILTPCIEQTLIHLIQDLVCTITAASCRPSDIFDRNESSTSTNRPGLYLLVVLRPVWDFASRVAVLAVVYSFVVLSDHCFPTPCFFHYSSADFSGLTAISVVKII